MIIEKYKDERKTDKVFNMINLSCICTNLKEVARLCGIDRNLTYHTARHSYATSVCLANGVSIENVAKMLGHSNIKMTQHYAKVLDSSILKDMMNVKSAIVNLG